MASTCVPKCADRYDVLRERIVKVRRETAEVEATQTSDLGLRVWGSRGWQEGEKSDRLFDFIREDFDGPAVVDPPAPGRTKLFTRPLSKDNLAALHSERSSRRTSLASTTRPALTSASDSPNARCRAARSSSLSQSPGSKGSSSISVPSGRSEGSSTIKRPFFTRALRVILHKIYENAAADKTQLGECDMPSNYSMQQTVRPVTSVAGQRPRLAVPQLTLGR